MIIGIRGKFGSGKDTLAKALLKYFPDAQIKKFAEKLKFITHYMTGVPMEDCYTDEGKRRFLPEWGMTIGEFQQRIGTDAIRCGLHKDAWVISTLAGYDRTKHQWVISDVRFINEAQAILDRGGILIEITRKSRDTSGRDGSHISETEMDYWTQWDYQFNNDGTLEAVDEFAKRVFDDRRVWLWKEGKLQ